MCLYKTFLVAKYYIFIKEAGLLYADILFLSLLNICMINNRNCNSRCSYLFFKQNYKIGLEFA